MIITTYTIEIITTNQYVKNADDESSSRNFFGEKILRFRDRKTRNQYLRNVVLKDFDREVDANKYDKTEISDLPNFKVSYLDPKDNWKYLIKTGKEHIEIIETVSLDNQLKLEF